MITRKLLLARNRILQILIWFAEILFFKSKAKPPIGYLELIRHSGIVSPSNPTRDFSAVQEWERSDSLWVQGEYLASVDLRKGVLRKLYESHGVLLEGYVPPGISIGFVGPIGHQAMLCTHIAAQKLGILKPRTAILPINKTQIHRPLIQTLRKDLNLLQYGDGASWSELPNNWHVFERLQLIRTENDFIDLYQLIEKVFRSTNVNKMNPLIELPTEYVDSARQKLEALGLPKDAWFVTIHVRNAGDLPARRNQPVDTYYPAIEEVIASGGWVIRVGDNSMEKFPEFSKFIDLATSKEDLSFLHPYVLAFASFYVGTSSGPGSVPPLFGVPTLITNATSIGRNLLSSSENSIYIPKKTLNEKGRLLSYSEVLKSCDGFGELELSQLRELNLQLQCNSKEEILLGVKEIMARVQNNFVEDKKSVSIINEIRNSMPYSSRGTIAHTFLDKHREWLS
jgi:putative glycosyltransferase (TIGR04372 family)